MVLLRALWAEGSRFAVAPGRKRLSPTRYSAGGAARPDYHHRAGSVMAQ
jgi:hypothetical protein